MRSDWHVRLSAYVPLILWIGVIFFLSSPAGSALETSKFIGPLLRFLFPAAPEETLRIYHGYVRKFAHFAEYAILAFWAIRAFSTSSVGFLRNSRFWLAILLVVLIAALDEYHQSFEPSRTSSVYDVLLDCIGGSTTAFVFWLFTERRSHVSGDTEQRSSE